MAAKLERRQPAGVTDPLRFYLCETAVGWIGLLLSPRGLRGSTTPRPAREEALRALVEAAAPAGGTLEPATEAEAGDLPRRLRDLAAGKPVSLAADIDWDALSGDGRTVTPFRRAVMEETMRIPPGETRTYGWLAAKVGRPRAARAVGRVMATNPLPVIVPCHRVVGSDGALHGYAGGLEVKEALLRLEGARGGYNVP